MASETRIACHDGVKHTAGGLRIVLNFKNPLATYIRNAADGLTDGCVCQLVQDLFLDRFKELSEEIDQLRKEKENGQGNESNSAAPAGENSGKTVTDPGANN